MITLKTYATTTMIDLVSRYFPRQCSYVTVEQGEVITSSVQPARHFYVLNKGSAKLLHEEPNAKSVILDIYHAGDFFGEMEMIGLSTDDRSIIALARCELYQVTRDQFMYLYETCSEFSLYILRVHCDRLLRSGDSQINAECMFLSEKVFRLIQDNLNEKGYFIYSKVILSEMAGVSIRSLNRALSELKEKKLITILNGTIRLNI